MWSGWGKGKVTSFLRSILCYAIYSFSAKQAKYKLKGACTIYASHGTALIETCYYTEETCK